jgi:hypothetical protein
MASYTDDSRILGNFNPFVQQVPTNAYVAVGLQKQQQYDEGVQRVQADINSITSLPVIKQEQKDYVNQRVGQLQSNLSKVVGQDFSNAQLVNQIGGLTSQIASDPIIQSAVSSTVRYQSESAKMDEARKAGKSDPANEYDFQNNFQNWLNDRDVKSSFTGSYTPYVDVKSKIVKAINESSKPDEQIQDLPFEMENGHVKLVNGAPVIDTAMIQQTTKSLTPEKIQAAINSSLSAGDINQLAINGRYQYRGLNKQGLKEETDNSYKYRLGQIDSILSGLANKKLINQTDQNYQEGLDAQIRDLSAHRNSLIKQYQSDIRYLDQNPEGYKGELYKQNWMANMTTSLSYAQNSLLYKDNPFVKVAHEDRAYALQAEKFRVESQNARANLFLKQAEFSLKEKESEEKRREFDRKNGIVGGAGGLNPLLGIGTGEPIDQSTLPTVNTNTFEQQTGEIQAGIQGKKLLALAALPSTRDHMDIIQHPGETSPTLVFKSEQDRVEAEAKLNELKDAWAKGKKVPAVVDEYFTDNANADQAIANRNAALASAKNLADKSIDLDAPLRGQYGVNVSIKGKDFHLSPKNLVTTIAKITQAQADAQTPIATGSGFGNPYAGANALKAIRGQFTTPQDALVYDVYSALQRGEDIPQGSQALATQISKLAPFAIKNREKINERNKLINNSLANIYQVKQPVAFSIDTSKPANLGAVRSAVGTLVSGFSSQGAGKLPQGSDLSTIGKFMKSKDTQYQLEKTSSGGTNIMLTNPEISPDAQRIPVTPEQVERYFPGSSINQLGYIDEALSYTANDKFSTTDITGQGAGSAFTLKTPNLNNYGVKYHVEMPFKDGRYQIKLYLSPKNGQPAQWKEMDSQLDHPLTREGLAAFLSNFGDQQVQELLKPTQIANALATSYTP